MSRAQLISVKVWDKKLKTEYKSKKISIAQEFFYSVVVGFLRVFFIGDHFITEITRTVLLLAT